MGWLGVLAAIGFFILAIVAPLGGSPGVLACLLLALVSLGWGMLRLLQDRLGHSGRREAELLSPAEIKALRERAEASRQPAPPAE
jgi:hypothetical protein